VKILLTGGSGFIGRNVRESWLAEKHEIVAPSHRELELADEDAVMAFLKAGHFDAVVHSATKPGHRNSKDSSNLFYSNSRMFFNLARCHEYFGRMLIVGSGAIYDMRHYLPKMKEEYFGTHVPADEHGFCKYVCGRYIERSEKITDLRVFGIFGKYEDYAIRFISNVACKAVFDLPITIKQNRRFDYIWVDDFLPVLEHFLISEHRHNAYNITPPASVELLELAEMVREISGKKLDIVVKEPGMGLEYSGDNSRLMSEMPGLTFTPLRKSVEALYRWYYDNRASLDRGLLLQDK